MNNMLRGVLRTLSRGRVLRRKLSPEFGARSLYATPEAALSFWKHDLRATCPEMFDSVEATVRPNDVVWDVGANVGLFSFAAAHIAAPGGHVVAFEPDTFLVELMRRSQASPASTASIDVLPLASAVRRGGPICTCCSSR